MFKYALGVALALFCCNAAQATCTQPVNGTTADATALTAYLNCEFAPLVSPTFTGAVGIGNGSPTYSLDVLRGGSSVARFAGTDTSYLLVDLSALGTGGAVQNMLRFVNGSSPKWSLGDNQGNSDAFVLSAGSLLTTAPVLVATQSGNIGIGTTTPVYSMEAYGATVALIGAVSSGANSAGIFVDNSAGGNQSSIFLRDGGTTKWQIGKASNNEYFVYDAANSKNDILTSSGNLLLQPTSGNVGIGTTAPLSKLQVVGDLTMGNATASTAYAIHTATASGSDNDYLALGGGGASNDTTRGAGINLMGNEFSGGLFGLYGDVIISAGQPNSGLGGSVLFQTNPAGTVITPMILTSAGNVGIGTTTPAVALTVVGDIRVGTSGTNGCLQNFAGTAVAGTCSSDARLKTVVGNVSGVLDKLSNLQLVKFYWTENAATIYHSSTTVRNTGFLAQAVAKQFPELVTLDKLGYRQLDYTTLSLYGIEAIKELKSLDDSQAAEIAALKSRLEDSDRRLSQFETRVNDLSRMNANSKSRRGAGGDTGQGDADVSRGRLNATGVDARLAANLIAAITALKSVNDRQASQIAQLHTQVTHLEYEARAFATADDNSKRRNSIITADR